MKQTQRFNIICVLVAISFIFISRPAFAQSNVLMMATTTSTDNTGLLDYLSPVFTKNTGIELKWTAVGTGKALKLGQHCDVDILLVHAPEAEKKYMKDNYGIDRREVMFNDFIIIGPESDPAGIKSLAVKEALKNIMEKKEVFVSRGDNSGTHKKEMALWKETGMYLPEKETWYIQTGQGMLASINISAERGGYTLTDRGTYIKYEYNHGGNAPLKILVERDDALRNQYSVMTINPENCPKCRKDLAGRFSDWIVSPKAQKLIKEYTLLEKQLFVPNAK
jgi:tungstate transport system substrate-binding protein